MEQENIGTANPFVALGSFLLGGWQDCGRRSCWRVIGAAAAALGYVGSVGVSNYTSDRMISHTKHIKQTASLFFSDILELPYGLNFGSH